MVVLRQFYPKMVRALGLSLLFCVGAEAATPAVPEEYESTGGQSLAFGGSVVSGIAGASAIRANPALLAVEKEYTVNGSYHWPTAGRDYYQLGVVDGKTSSVAAGFTYTGAMDNYQGISSSKLQQSPSSSPGLSKDTPIQRRAGLAFALPLGKLFVGAGASYVEARPPAESLTEEDSAKVKAFTTGFGLAGYLTPALRFGISAENLANRKIQYAAPTFYRAGASYFFGEVASVHLDYRRREAVSLYEGLAPSFTMASESSANSATGAESLLNASASVKVYDLLRLVAATGQTRSEGHSATRIAGGLALVNRKFNFSYQALRPDLTAEAVHHALSLGLDVAM